MDNLFLAFILALSKLIILCKMLGAARTVRFQVPLDVFFTLIVPILVPTFRGTVTGTIIAILSGVIFSIMLFILSVFVKPEPKLKIHGRELF